ncbi:hypothetical protein FXF51_32755 [Nonomuraea sp. PA05]|uniref:WXG100 family type VII secretion target n=1 Tax=Nonomuraea sp. PA05 TaxID=2604466 RepID=UPI0011D50617|nr:hypothetical protein [Nonomuraea sp. PA05]TYB59791.1 hypothetical protein FXF51_32755 [Nonomuraea sp. PA05]
MSDPYLNALSPVSRGSSPLIPLNPDSGKIGSMSAAGAESSASRGLATLRAAGRLSSWVVPAVMVAATVNADEGEIARAGTIWSVGMSARLDDGVKNLMPQILKTSETGWIAADQQEYARVHARFHGEIGALRKMFDDIGKVLDEIAAAFRAYWVAISVLGAAAFAALVRALWLKMFPAPQTRALGMLLEQLTGAKVLTAVTIGTGVMGALLSKGGDTLTTMAKKERQFGYVAPTGIAAIDFQRARLDLSHYPSFKEPPAPGKLPAGSQNFDWIAPDVSTTTP